MANAEIVKSLYAFLDLGIRVYFVGILPNFAKRL
ncbi:hypothetical protein Mic7113_4256 [Allocoleopsis franciscana PCC 7113]|uniref:Uncharacterized protein n=1 Tax=Allocoleopsis franciscana PCC 7113 TaxID=1173027 RepID=K9WHR8_9CYAN|nr:hypothetical protein Mic7113_4256 [Allocoleopsis franciscana PCC 7113]